jgi:SAM-dependent methyltransferase
MFMLDLWRCRPCGHVQLGLAVDPARLFRNYVYVSGTSPSFVKHFEEYAAHLIDQDLIQQDQLIVEIGSNDGTLLHQFKKRGYELVCGYEPATKIAEQAWKTYQVRTYADFFNETTASYLMLSSASPVSEANLVIANNVFAHVADLQGLTRAVRNILAEDGVFVFEVSYLVDVITKCLFDTIYHEHLDYHSVYPLTQFFVEHGLRLYDVERIDTHGGSIRCYVDREKRPVTYRVDACLQDEESLGLVPNGDSPYDAMIAMKAFQSRIISLGNVLRGKIDVLRAEGKKIIGYGAPAKATTLMYEFGLTKNDISHIVDDSPWKQGLLTPGLNIPVVPASSLAEIEYDYILILAWNFADNIIAKYRGKPCTFIVPIPELREVPSS